jgi:hypothetical protein
VRGLPPRVPSALKPTELSCPRGHRAPAMPWTT